MLTVTLEATYPETLVSAEDFSATLISQEDPTITRELYVMSVDDATKSLQIKFPGADSGMYNLFLVGKGVGRIDKEPLELEVSACVEDISNLRGSYLGGTLLTIDGENFSDDPLDNPVLVGGNWCYVLASSPTQITCRIAETGTELVEDAQVIVYLRTSEAATMTSDDVFSFVEPRATVTALTSEFDDADNTLCLSLTGSGFGSDSEGIELYIDGVLQTVVEVDDDEVIFTVVDMLDETSDDIQIYFADGLPAGYTTITSLTVTPTLVSISPSSGSSGGTLLTVTGTGFGTNTAGLNLLHAGNEMCDEVNITGYGAFTCLTKAMEIVSGDAITL